MSSQDSELNLDKLFLPSWATEATTANRFANYTGNEEVKPGRRSDRQGGDRRRPDGGRPPGGPRDFRRPPGGPQGQQGGGQPGQGQGQGFGGPRRFDRGSDRGDRGPRRPGGRPGGFREERPPEAPLPEVNVNITVDENGVESLARQIRMSGRAYPMFDIAQIVLQKPERHQFVFNVVKKPDGQPAQKLFVCALDNSLWLSEAEALAYVLDRHFHTFYQAERTATEPPKGVYTFVGQCGMSGVIFGPPNYHDYQSRLRKLHAERFARMPFEAYKARVKIVRDEAVVKKWVEEQSWKTEYVCLNVPDAPRLATREAVEKHFRDTHLATIIQSVDTCTLPGPVARQLRCSGLYRLVRVTWEDQKRFPLRLVTFLSQQFTARGLQFFKRDKTITHVSVARPHYLDLDLAPISDNIKRIINFINTTPRCNRAKMIEALSPTPAQAPAPVPPPPAQVEATAPAEGAPATPAPAATPVAPEMTAEQMQLVGDLYWLIHQGHVIEFANGALETAKKPVPRPPRPEPKAAQKQAATPTEVQPAGESAVVSADEIKALSEASAAAEEAAAEAAEAQQPAGEAPAPAPVEPVVEETKAPEAPTAAPGT